MKTETKIKIAIKGKIGESYNIGSGQEFRNIDLAHAICDLMDQKLNLKKSSKQLITFVTDRLGHDFRYAIDNTKINKELNWYPITSFKDGLKQTIDFYKNLL